MPDEGGGSGEPLGPVKLGRVYARMLEAYTTRGEECPPKILGACIDFVLDEAMRAKYPRTWSRMAAKLVTLAQADAHVELRADVDPSATPAPAGNTVIHIHQPVTGTDKAELAAKRAALEREAEGGVA